MLWLVRGKLAALLIVVSAVLAAAVVRAQVPREARVLGAQLTAQEGECWSNSLAPCEGVDQASVEVRTGARALRVRVVAVEVLPQYQTEWRTATGVEVQRRSAMVARAPRTREAIQFEANARDELKIWFQRVPAGDARVRITLDVAGRRVVLETTHVIVTEHPDPEL